jgi:hypothetical protein
MRLFPERAMSPESITLSSGPVEVYRFSWRFPLGERPTYKFGDGRKPTVVWEGKSIYAELAIMALLKQHGFSDTIWRENFSGCFREAMPPASCTMPGCFREVCGRILAINESWRGCWDVLAMSPEGLMFVECKRKGDDDIRPSQRRWLESALKAGFGLENFAVCEWELDI